MEWWSKNALMAQKAFDVWQRELLLISVPPASSLMLQAQKTADSTTQLLNEELTQVFFLLPFVNLHLIMVYQ